MIAHYKFRHPWKKIFNCCSYLTCSHEILAELGRSCTNPQIRKSDTHEALIRTGSTTFTSFSFPNHDSSYGQKTPFATGVVWSDSAMHCENTTASAPLDRSVLQWNARHKANIRNFRLITCMCPLRQLMWVDCTRARVKWQRDFELSSALIHRNP